MTTTIPAPPSNRIVYGAVLRASGVRIDRDGTTFHVVMIDDEVTWKFSVQPATSRLDSYRLTDALRTGEPPGRIVAVATAGCGGGLGHLTLTAADLESISTVTAAIPYFYEDETDREARKMLRAIYPLLMGWKPGDWTVWYGR